MIAAGLPGKLAMAIEKSNHIMAEDIIREAGYMLPQRGNVHTYLQKLVENPPASDFPKETAEKLLKMLNNNDVEEDTKGKNKNMKKWKFSRLNRLMQAILLLSVAHSRYVQDSEKSVIIDVAVKLSKRFLDDGDYKFVNAILDVTL